MLDVLVYIPTIMAYSFVLLLVIILCFVVLYIGHKVYISIYDNLPQMSSYQMIASPEPLLKMERIGKSLTAYDLNMLTRRESLDYKSKTALRIIVALEPCYLAYVIFKAATLGKTRKPSVEVNDVELSEATLMTGKSRDNTRLLKYFESLRTIPMGSVMMKCSKSHLTASGTNLTHVIDAVAQRKSRLRTSVPVSGKRRSDTLIRFS